MNKLMTIKELAYKFGLSVGHARLILRRAGVRPETYEPQSIGAPRAIYGPDAEAALAEPRTPVGVHTPKGIP